MNSAGLDHHHPADHELQHEKWRSAIARRGLLETLAGASEAEWLSHVRAFVLRSDAGAARDMLSSALAAYPDSLDLRFSLAGLLQQDGDLAAAESLLRELLAQWPAHAAATFLLAQLLKQQGRMHAAAVTIRELFDHGRHDLATLIQAVELLDDCERKTDAAAICEAGIAAGCNDPRLHAYAGMLEIQLGEFARARQHYLLALANDERALEWNIPIGLSSMQRYRDMDHPDFQLFNDALQRPTLSERARCTTLFALGKAHDDISDYARATCYLRQANVMAHAATTWSRKSWRRGVEARLARKPQSFRLEPPPDWTPVFIVGVPRSGTTLVAELLARHPEVCNRGELPWLARFAQSLSGLDKSHIEVFERTAAAYAAQLRQDDSTARWFIDKQPLNLQYVDLILALWPHARIINCQRSPRDVALSLWSHSFMNEMQGYAYDFADIAVVIKDCGRLMAHWQRRYAPSIYTVDYQALTADPEGVIAGVSVWLQLPDRGPQTARRASSVISTASLWQARQPVYTRSVDRWQHYAVLLPELLSIPEN